MFPLDLDSSTSCRALRRVVRCLLPSASHPEGVHHENEYLLCLCLLGSLAASGQAEPPAPGQGVSNRFFAMNFERHDPKISSSRAAQAALLKELGYDGCQHLGPLEWLREAQEAMGAQGLEIFAAAIPPYNVSIDPGETYPAVLKDAIRELKGRKTLLLFQFVSKALPRSSAAGDARAVELGRELADYARPYGVRLVLYHHVGARAIAQNWGGSKAPSHSMGAHCPPSSFASFPIPAAPAQQPRITRGTTIWSIRTASMGRRSAPTRSVSPGPTTNRDPYRSRRNTATTHKKRWRSSPGRTRSISPWNRNSETAGGRGICSLVFGC